ncbi:MAG: SdrD B-like domain-containing protein, partial [Planctomycetota bacterium]
MPPGPVIAVGDTVNWTYVVSNPGEYPLVDIAVTDDQGVVVTCPMTTLAVGESMTCTGTGVATGGQYENIGSVSAQPTDPNTGEPFGLPTVNIDPSHYFGAGGGLRVEKSTNGVDADTPTGPQLIEGTPITWTYTVTNIGNVIVAGIAVSDSEGVAVSCPGDTLAPGASLTCTGTGVAVVGQYMNLGTAIGQPVDGNGNPIGVPVSGSDPSHYLGVELPRAVIGDSVFIDRDRDGQQDAGEPGLPGVTVNLWIDNDADGTPDEIVATTTSDANGNYLFGDVDSRLTYFVQFVATPGLPFTTPNVGDDATDSDADPATGITPAITVVPGETNLTIDAGVIELAGSLGVEKLTNGEDADTPTGPILEPGTPITWTYIVTNTGELTVTGISVSDDQGVVVSCPGDTLAPGASLTCTGTGVAEPGQYANLGTATGQPVDGGTPIGDPVSGSDMSHYFGNAACVDGSVADHFNR